MAQASRVFKNLGVGMVGLLLAVILAACGDQTVVLQLPTSTAGATTAPATTTVPSTTVSDQIVSPIAPTSTPVPTVTAEPTATATAEATATPSPEASPTVTTGPPTATPAPTTATAPATTRRGTSTPRPTVVPTATATPAKIDAAAELKVIKAAYDAINEHYYTQPDTAKLGQSGLEEAATALNVALPATPAWTADAANNWQLFQQNFQQMAAKSSVQLSQGMVAHQVAVAFAGAVGDLHTYFNDQKRTDTINRMSRGDNSTVGFGLSFVVYQNSYYVQRLVTGAPAQAAGVKIGYQLVEFDGVAITSSTYSRLATAKEGQTYDFVFKPFGGTANVNLKITFKRYTVQTVEWQIIDNHIGFITINAFQLDVQTRLDEAIAAVKAKGADSLIIDLRYNGGGYNFDRVSGRFIANGTTLGKFTNRSGTSSVRARSEGKQVIPAIPLVVMIDRNSASASEVFALAVRDFQAGTLVGGKSVGAIGTVAYWPLGDGTSLGVTNSIYETVKGEKLNGVGITPDIVVARTTEDILNGRDPQLAAAVTELETKAKDSH